MSIEQKFPRTGLLLLALLLSFIALYPTLGNGWVNWDDDAYVLRNPMVQEWSGESVGKMFTTEQQVGLYHPLTMLSLGIDHALWGLDAQGYHLSNILLHLFNVLLVFLLLGRLGLGRFGAFTGALLFGLHPMHLESVAWISARKDVLYTAFFFLSIHGYLSFRQANSGRKWLFYTACVLSFLAALLSKGMAFTLPFVLLLVDFLQGRDRNWKMVLEKTPLFLLSIVALVVAQRGQADSDSLLVVDQAPIYQTAFIGTFNAPLYILKSVVPFHLAPFHPFPFLEKFELPWYYYASIIPFLTGLFFLYRAFRRRPKLFFGFAFFLLTIGTVLQAIPFGKAVFAERYTYVSYFGLFFLVGLAVDHVLRSESAPWKSLKMPLLAGIALWMGVLGVVTYQQAAVWENGETLWSDVIDKYPDHYFAYRNRGQYLIDGGAQDQAKSDLDRCIALNPAASDCFYERGRWYEAAGDGQSAFNDYSAAVQVDPQNHRAFLNRAMLQLRARDLASAEADLNRALAVKPDYALAHLNRGVVMENKGDRPSALADYNAAIALEPNNAVFYRYRGVFHYFSPDLEAAHADFDRAIALKADYANAWYLRSKVWRDKGVPKRALEDAREAQRLGYVLPEGYLEGLVPPP